MSSDAGCDYIIVGAGSSGAMLTARLTEDTRLRVIDGSIMPEVPSANTHLTCVMIGEVMAEWLKRG